MQKNSTLKTLALGLLLAFGAAAQTNQLDVFFAKVADIESNSGERLSGDGGRSLGWYHMGKAAWSDVSSRRANRGEKVYPWKASASNKAVCDIYAEEHLRWLADGLSRNLGRCDEQLLYAAWNCGLRRVLEVRGDIRKLPRTTRRNVAKFSRTEVVVAVN